MSTDRHYDLTSFSLGFVRHGDTDVWVAAVNQEDLDGVSINDMILPPPRDCSPDDLVEFYNRINGLYELPPAIREIYDTWQKIPGAKPLALTRLGIMATSSNKYWWTEVPDYSDGKKRDPKNGDEVLYAAARPLNTPILHNADEFDWAEVRAGNKDKTLAPLVPDQNTLLRRLVQLDSGICIPDCYDSAKDFREKFDNAFKEFVFINCGLKSALGEQALEEVIPLGANYYERSKNYVKLQGLKRPVYGPRIEADKKHKAVKTPKPGRTLFKYHWDSFLSEVWYHLRDDCQMSHWCSYYVYDLDCCWRRHLELMSLWPLVRHRAAYRLLDGYKRLMSAFASSLTANIQWWQKHALGFLVWLESEYCSKHCRLILAGKEPAINTKSKLTPPKNCDAGKKYKSRLLPRELAKQARLKKAADKQRQKDKAAAKKQRQEAKAKLNQIKKRALKREKQTTSLPAKPVSDGSKCAPVSDSLRPDENQGLAMAVGSGNGNLA